MQPQYLTLRFWLALLSLAGIVLKSAAGTITTTVIAPATTPWTDSGIKLHPGDVVHIAASGSWCPDTFNRPFCGPGGLSIPAGDVYLKSAPWSCLLGRVNNSYFEVGVATTFVSATSGALSFGINDDGVSGNYSDNAGSMTVTTVQISASTQVPVNTGNPTATKLGTIQLDPLRNAQEPVDTGTGAQVLSLTLLKTRGRLDLDFVIDYNSIARSNDVIGNGWSHNFEASLHPLPNGAVQLNWNAKRFNVFSPQAGGSSTFTCADLPVVYDVLLENPDHTFSLKEPSQRILDFDASGRLTSIVSPHGQRINVVYNQENSSPAEILDEVSGKSFRLTYNGDNLLSTVTDGLGRKVSFLYNSNYLMQVILADASVTLTLTNVFLYDSRGHLASQLNPDGAYVFTNTYDAQGRVSSQVDALTNSLSACFVYDESQTNLIRTTVVDRAGGITSYLYNTNYELISFVDALGHTTSYGYDARGNKIATTNALGAVSRFLYDARGNTIESFDPLSSQTTFEYDARNNLVGLTNALEANESFAYDSSNNLVTSVDFMTNTVGLAYDENSQLARKTSTRGGITSFSHAGGLTTGIIDAAGNKTQMAYDAVGRLIAITNADGFVSTNAYDLNDNIIAAADGLGNTWHYVYDSAGRKLSSTDPLGNSTFFVYNGNGDLIFATNALGGVTTYAYDGEDRLMAITDANGHTNDMGYDAAGRLAFVADALNHTNFFQRDAAGNVLATVDALGVTNQMAAYDQRNQPIASQDALGNRRVMTYDAIQRLVQTVDALSRTNRFSYDLLNHLIIARDPLSLVTRQSFDGDGNRTAVINPRAAQTSFVFDLANRMLTNTTPMGRQTIYALNGRNLVTNITQPSGAQTVLTYDAAGRLSQSQDAAGTIVYTYDAKGRLLTTAENGGTLIRKYDALDRLTNYTDVFGNVIQYAYDAVGNLTNLTYPDGKQVAYAYDAANRLITVTDWNNRATTYTYDADNRVLSISHPNGTMTICGYDLDGRLSVQQDLTTASNLIHSVAYGYDSVGQIVGETNQPLPLPYQPVPVQMTFDLDDALTSFAGQTVSNDLNGNMIFGPASNGVFISFDYDARNRLINAGGVSYGYDPAGNRVSLTNGGNSVLFVINPNAALSQLLMRIQNSVTNYYVYGIGLLYEDTLLSGTNRELTYHFDYRGSTVAITDAGGSVTDRISYSPYGGVVSRAGNIGTPFLFNGSYGVMTEANGLLFMRARYYIPAACRFLTPDPTTFAGRLSFYCFAASAPTSLVDPGGTNPLLLIGLYLATKGQEDFYEGIFAQALADTVARKSSFELNPQDYLLAGIGNVLTAGILAKYKEVTAGQQIGASLLSSAAIGQIQQSFGLGFEPGKFLGDTTIDALTSPFGVPGALLGSALHGVSELDQSPSTAEVLQELNTFSSPSMDNYFDSLGVPVQDRGLYIQTQIAQYSRCEQ